MGLQFHETVRGARFFDHEVPTLIKSINRLAAAIEESNRLQQEVAAKTVATPAKQAETYFCYTAYNAETYAATTFCRSARETIVWANAQIEGAVEEGFELVSPFTAEREFFNAIADAKAARIEMKHSDGRTRYIGFERE
jgi:hypothetical protein